MDLYQVHGIPSIVDIRAIACFGVLDAQQGL